MTSMKVNYTSPKAELFLLGERLNIMANFSTTSTAEDWDGGDELENEADTAP